MIRFIRPFADPGNWPVALFITLHSLLAGHAFVQHNPTIDESGHLLSGLYACKYGDFSYYHVNPPLVKALQAAVLLPASPDLPNRPATATGLMPADTSEWLDTRDRFLWPDPGWLASRIWKSRSVNLILSVVCGLLIYRWSTELFGRAGGLTSLALWTLSPNILAWAGVCTADLGAALFATAAIYGLRHYLRQPGVATAVAAGGLLGAAQLAKFSLLILYPVTVLVWLIAWRVNRPKAAARRPRPGQLAVILAVSVLVINLGYGFRHVGRPLGSFLFKSQALSGAERGLANRFHGGLLGDMPVPLPASYVTGLDEQKSHVDRGIRGYLRGEWSDDGWWHYALYALAVKTPLGTLAVAALAVGLLFSRSYRLPKLEEGFLWLPPAAFLILFCAQTGLNAHMRYMLPLLSFMFIACGRVGMLLPRFAERVTILTGVGPAIVIAALAWNAAAVWRTHPHHISYFNEPAGGPENGWRHLVGADLDWGQDLIHLKHWVDAHPDVRPLRVAFAGGFPPQFYGLECAPVPARGEPLKPGYHAVSVNFVAGMGFWSFGPDGRRVYVRPGTYGRFRHRRPVARAGHSILIYHVGP